MDNYIKFRMIRTENGFTQEEVAKMLGITRATYCSYEIGRRRMSIDMLRKLAICYHISIDSFFTEEKSKKIADKEHYGSPMSLSSLSKEERELVVSFRLSGDEKRKKILQAVRLKDDEYGTGE